MRDIKNSNWNYDGTRKVRGSERYVIREGEEVIGEIYSPGAADLICRTRNHSARQASENAFQARQHRIQVSTLREDIRILIDAVDLASDALRQTTRERDVTAARERLRRVLRMMKSRGHTV